ncbi:hypothetical protein DPEC_G00064080 [Dallia pectoralis]|uniref:Uncharacterized protein n=1 Tax=Dallia pectoralis TaxID=75939 RepID=A0ACC2H8W7_DALPE|nr:hypothetical protein DPEC_G00064080 [Dallia pectoralis]
MLNPQRSQRSQQTWDWGKPETPEEEYRRLRAYFGYEPPMQLSGPITSGPRSLPEEGKRAPEGVPRRFLGELRRCSGRTAERAPTVLVLQERPPLLRGCRQGEGNPWSYSHYPRRGKTLFCRRRQGQKNPGGVG